MIEYMLRKVKISSKYKDQLISRIVSKMMNKQYKYFEEDNNIDMIASEISNNTKDKI